MEQAEHDLLADLRRARRSLRLQDMDEPPAVARLTPGQRIADAVATVMGSWSFIIVQSAILFVWITANLVVAIRGWDPYPFILLNLALSFQAAYAAPVIMMSQNRQQDIDRKAAENDYRINVKAELEIELLFGVGCTRARCGRRTAVITRGYRLHGVTSFPIRRAEFHASPVPCSSGAQPLSVLCGTTLLSTADGGNPPWSLAVSQAANPDPNHRTGFPRDSTSSTISRCLRPAPRRGSSPRTGLSR
jgi:Protein of unknown function (DUF1003)